MKSSNGLNRYTGFDERKELYKLVQDHITAIINGDEINPIQMSVIEGVETMKVTVTVALPPMDYVTPDGTPAGFNIALPPWPPGPWILCSEPAPAVSRTLSRLPARKRSPRI